MVEPMTGGAGVRVHVLCAVLALGATATAVCQGDDEDRYPDAPRFRQLPLTEQLAVYLESPPPTRTGIGHPAGLVYRDIIAAREDSGQVYELVKRQLQQVEFAYSPGDPDRPTTLSDYRFDLLGNLVAKLVANGKLFEVQRAWLAEEFDRRIVEYVRTEKRIDENVELAAYTVDAYLLFREEYRLSRTEYSKMLYTRYVVEMKLVPEDEIGLQDRLVFPGYSGKVVPR
jgi:hypothetical protein